MGLQLHFELVSLILEIDISELYFFYFRLQYILHFFEPLDIE